MSGLMRNLLRLTAILLVLEVAGTAQAPTRPERSKGAQAAIAQLEQRWVTALNNADIPAIDGILGDDFVRPAPSTGTFINKAQLLGYYRSHLSAQSGVTRRIEDMMISVDGATGIARGIVVTASADDKHDARQLFTDVFVLRGGEWLAVSAQENPIAHQ